MRKLSTLLVPGLVAMTLAAGPALTSAYAAGGDTPSSPPSSDTSTKKGKKKSSSVSDPKFLAAYRTAYTTIYDNHDYTGAIGQLKSLKRDDVADVANLIGYSYRKLGDYQVVEDLLRAGAEGRSEPRPHLAVLRPLAARAGQPRAGAVSPEQARLARRHRQLRISLARRRARQADRARRSFTKTLRIFERSERAQPQGCARFAFSASLLDQILSSLIGAQWTSGCDPRSTTSAPGSNSSTPQSSSRACIVAFAHRGEIVAEHAFGLANLDTGEKLTPRHRFRIASHSKSFTSAGIMKLREQRKLRLDDTVGQYVGGLHPRVAETTIAQLLSHSAGLTRDGADSGQFIDRRPYLSAKELLAELKLPTAIEPGTRFKYSNHGFGLLGLVDRSR